MRNNSKCKVIKHSSRIGVIFSNPTFKIVRKGFLLLSRRDAMVDDLSVAYIAGKKIGCAVSRNFAKRRMRALVHECTEFFSVLSGVEVLFIARASLLNADYIALREEFAKSCTDVSNFYKNQRRISENK